jgi:steroid 5-alpha reductase family enzyme
MAIFAWLFLASLSATLLGWKKFLWFISLGYGLAVAAIAAVALWLSADTAGTLSTLQLLLVLAYGVRLAGFLFAREREPSYVGRAPAKNAPTDVAFSSRLLVWISVSLLYVAMVSPAVIASASDAQGSVAQALGLVVALVGLGVEALADQHKTSFKRTNPGTFCSDGLFSVVRFPAYLGEIVFWLGNFVAGVASFSAWWHFAVSLCGLLTIVSIMLSSTKRLEASQAARFEGDARFRSYAKTVPILVPGVPWFTMN